MDPKGRNALADDPTAGSAKAGYQSGLVTLVFTDVVGSTALKQNLGDRAGFERLQTHHALVRQLLTRFQGAEEISTAGDSFFLVFPGPSDAVQFALLLQTSLRLLNQGASAPVEDRVGLHLGEVVIAPTAGGKRDLHGLSVDVCARVMSLAQPGQVLMTRSVFDNARQSLKGEDIQGTGNLDWLNHGRFELKGVEESVEICEVRSQAVLPLAPPTTSEKARRVESAEAEIVLGWRPAAGQIVPNTQWVLEKSLGEGGFGEVWLGRHLKLRERRVFKFCFRGDRARTLRREVTLFRLLKERVGEHPNIVRVLEVYFEQPPYYLEMDYAEGQDLASWCAAHGGPGKVPVAVKLEVVAQVADALQAAHQAGVIHRDVKPANILVSSKFEPRNTNPEAGAAITARLTDFGIGQVVSEECLADLTRSGFTQTMLASSSSQTGTQLYMAPELLAGKPATTRADIYSLGVVLFQFLVGDFRRPVTTDWAAEIEDSLLRDDLQHCFAGNPDARFAGAGQLAKSLRSWEQRKAEQERERAQEAERDRLRLKAEQRRRLSVVAAGLALVLLALAGALGYGLRKARAERDQQRRLTYAADMNVAQQALAWNDLGRARRLLDSHRPKPGQADLRGWEWRYLWQECQSDSLDELCRYSNSTYSVDFSPDGKMLAVAGFASVGFIDLWDIQSRKRVARLQEDRGHLVGFSAGGNLLAADEGNRIRLWRADSTNIVGEITLTAGIARFKFSPDGSRLAGLGFDGELTIWEVGQNTRIQRIQGIKTTGLHAGVLDFSPDGRSLVVGDASHQLIVFDVATGRTNLFIPEAHPELITALAWSPEGEVIASGSGYSASPVRLWEAATGKSLGVLEGHTSWICRLVFSTDGQRLYSSSADQTIRVWDLEQLRSLGILRGSGDEVYGLALSPDGATLASGTKDGVVALWSAVPESADDWPKFIPHRREGLALFTPDSRSVALGREGTVSLLELAACKDTVPLSMLGTNLVALFTYSPDGTLMVTTGTEGKIGVWSLRGGRLLRELTAGEQRVLALKFREDGKRLLSIDIGGNATWWDTQSWQVAHSFAVAVRGGSAALSPDGRVLALAGGPTIHWYNPERGELLARTEGHRHGASGVAFSPNSRQAASVAEDGTVALWDAVTFKPISIFKGHMQGAHSVAFSPDGLRLLTGAGSREAVKLWDLSTQRELIALAGLGSLFRFVAVSPDGTWIAAVGMRNELHLWRAPTWAEIQTAAEKPRKP